MTSQKDGRQVAWLSSGRRRGGGHRNSVRDPEKLGNIGQKKKNQKQNTNAAFSGSSSLCGWRQKKNDRRLQRKTDGGRTWRVERKAKKKPKRKEIKNEKNEQKKREHQTRPNPTCFRQVCDAVCFFIVLHLYRVFT